MPKVLKIAGIALAAVVVLLGGVLLFVDVDQFRPMIQEQLESSLKRKVTLGPMGLKLIPLAIRVEQVSIAEDPSFGSTPFLSAKEIAVRVGLLPLLSKKVRVDSLRIIDPSVELIKNASGKWNFSTLGESSSSSSSGGDGFALAELMLENGRIGLTDHKQKEARVQYDDIDLLLRDLAPGKPFTADLTMRFPEKLAATVNVQANYDKPASRLDIASLALKLGGMSLSGAGSIAPAQVNLQVKTENASITELAKVAAAFGAAFSSDMNVTGMLGADVHIQGPTDALQYSGNISLSKLEVNRSGWKQPIRIAELKAQLTPQEIKTNPFEVQSGNTRVTASAAVQDYTGEPRLRAEVMTKGANLQELINVGQAYGISTMDGIDANGTISLDVKVSGTAKDLDFAGSGTLQDATLQPPTLTKPLLVKSANLRFTEGSAVLENMQASLGTSNLRGSAKVKNFASPELEFNADVDQLNVAEMQQITKPAPPSPTSSKKPAERPILKMKGRGTLGIGKIQYSSFVLSKVKSECVLDKGLLKLEPLTAELFGGQQRGAIAVDMRPENAAYAVQTKFERVSANDLMSATTNLKNLLFGLMAADGAITMNPKPGEEIAKSLNGRINLNLHEGRLSGISIVNEMAKVAKVLGFAQKAEPVTNILALTGSLKLDDGVASTDDLKLAFEGGSLSAAGTVGLVDSALKLKITSVLSRALSDQFGGNTRIGGYMSTALGNPKGELVIPCLVSGSTSRPVFAPDGAEFAKLKLQHIVPSVTNPAGIADTVKGVIGAGKQGGGKGVGGALLDMFGGRKKAEEKKEP